MLLEEPEASEVPTVELQSPSTRDKNQERQTKNAKPKTQSLRPFTSKEIDDAKGERDGFDV